ncbi:hypothetical protein [Taibaiella koreensis]|uniref:hypothetical protein n=1 Tax=Taibaiella koreensis TaxID=1268548 RepID=UPI000E59CA56|nr:hypothetical protein [Taibaiella koreensis]
MKKSYGSTVWKLLREYAIWQPGAPTELGDFGLIKDGCFERIGNIRDYIGDVVIKSKANTLDQMSLRSDSTWSREGKPEKKVAVTLEFKKNNGVLLSAKGIEVSSFLEMQKAGALIAQSPDWDRSWFVVTSVRHADRFVLVISKDLKAAIEGPEDTIDGLMQGDPGDMSQVQLMGAIQLKLIGNAGPLSVRLHQMKSRGPSFRHLEGSDEDVDELVLTPYLAGVKE